MQASKRAVKSLLLTNVLSLICSCYGRIVVKKSIEYSVAQYQEGWEIVEDVEIWIEPERGC
jgi:hypothetical protein